MRDRIWEIRYNAEFNSAYWRRLELKARKFDIGLKIVLGVGTVSSFFCFVTNTSLQFMSAVIGLICAFVSTVVLPACSWENLISRIQNVRHRWIDLAGQAKRVWEDFEDEEKVTRKTVEGMESVQIDLDRESFWFGDCEKLKVLAEKDTLVALGIRSV